MSEYQEPKNINKLDVPHETDKTQVWVRRPKWTNEKPTKDGWYWWRGDSAATDGVIVQVHPRFDTVGPWGDGTTSKLSEEKGDWAGPLEKPV